MPTSPTDGLPQGARRLVFLEDGSWIVVAEAGVLARGGGAALPDGPAVLAVPGTEVVVHWLALDAELTQAQAAAAARLMLADASATPLADMHVAVGRAEAGLTPAALVPAARMVEWLAAAELLGVEADAVVPTHFLLLPPEAGFARRELDHRGPAAAFALEPDLAEALTGEAPVEEIDTARFEAGLPTILAALPIDLRQGPFAKRRQWKLDQGWGRRVAIFAGLIVLLTLAIQIALIVKYNNAASRLEAETAAVQQPAAGARLGFGPIATQLFEAVRSTPNLELARIEYRPDGSLAATVSMDSPATFAAFRARIEAGGLRVEGGEPSSAAGRPTAEFTVRPA